MLNIRYLIIIPILVFLLSCSKKIVEENVDQKSTTEVTLTNQQMKLNEISLGSPENRKMSQSVFANGNVDVPPQYIASISVAIGGFVKSTEVLEGDHVHKGEILGVLTHPDYIAIQEQYIEVLSKNFLLQKELERQQYLRNENINSKKELERVESEIKINAAQIKAVEARLHILGMNPESVSKGNITSQIEVRSPLDGEVTFVNTTLGKFVRAEETIFEVVSKDHIHLELKVYEQDVLKIKPNQIVMFTLGNDEENVRKGKVVLVGKKLDPNTRTVSIHAHPDEDVEGMLPGMYVKAKIHTMEKETLTLPEEAVVMDGGSYFIFIKKKSEGDKIYFEKTPVKTGLTQDGFTEVKLPQGSFTGTVVVKGTYFVAAELKKLDSDE